MTQDDDHDDETLRNEQAVTDHIQVSSAPAIIASIRHSLQDNFESGA